MSQPYHKSQLTLKQRYHIGGVEYRAIDFLSKLVPFFYFFTIVVFCFALRIYIACSTYAQGVLETSNPEPVNPWMFSFFTGVAAFNNLGLTPLSASLVPFQSAPAPLILCSLLVVFGNTAYAIVLRGIIWCLYKIIPHHYIMATETMRFLLDHPRRCYTNLFSSSQTWWLVFALVTINLVEIVVFLATNFWLPVLEGLSWGSRVLDAYFQGVAIRNAGFSVVNLELLNPGTQIVYIIAMYISVYPVAISIRNSNLFQVSEIVETLQVESLTDADIVGVWVWLGTGAWDL
ncbi:hypothetical protein K492DRAFT_126339 [Lichtheimia hyalospora FSU 10163]|nr:hypothetical protein K492DRAFT_126339 [Lichtheimia hyalospora FSU 10163]